MLKTKIIGNDWFALSVAPFVDSGAGSRGEYSVTRSSEPTAGWLAMMTLGQNGPVEFNVNGGWRYRNGSETVGDYRLRNEALYQGSLTFHATRWMGLFVAGQGRRLMMAERVEGQAPEYHASTGGNATAGMTLKFSDIAVSGFGGRAVKKDSFGFGQTVAGMSISYVIGGRHEPGFAREISESVSEGDIAAPTPAKRKAKNEVTVYPDEMSGKFDPMAELEKARAAGKTEKDDFDMIEARMADERARGSSSIAFEDELSKLRAEEAKMDVERTKKRDAEDRVERAREAKLSKQRTADKKRYEREAKEAAAKLPSIQDEDYNWGLE
jgi:hypothetical protein